MEKVMTAAEEKLAAMKASSGATNPANPAGKPAAERVRVPMTSPMRRLEVAELPGYWLQWIRGTQERIQQALNAGFIYVSESELSINNFDIGGDAKTSGNTDMGTRVSTGDGSGEMGRDGQPIRMFLMKQSKEHHDEDTGIVQSRNDSVVDSLTANFRSGTVGVGAEGAPAETGLDVKTRYVGSQTKIPDLFKRKA